MQDEGLCQVSGHEAIVSMVSLGLGVGLVPQLVIEQARCVSKFVLLIVHPIKTFSNWFVR